MTDNNGRTDRLQERQEALRDMFADLVGDVKDLQQMVSSMRTDIMEWRMENAKSTADLALKYEQALGDLKTNHQAQLNDLEREQSKRCDELETDLKVTQVKSGIWGTLAAIGTVIAYLLINATIF